MKRVLIASPAKCRKVTRRRQSASPCMRVEGVASGFLRALVSFHDGCAVCNVRGAVGRGCRAGASVSECQAPSRQRKCLCNAFGVTSTGVRVRRRVSGWPLQAALFCRHHQPRGPGSALQNCEQGFAARYRSEMSRGNGLRHLHGPSL